MTGYGKRMVFILMLFFSLGLGLGLLENHNVKMEKDQNEEYASPQKKKTSRQPNYIMALIQVTIALVLILTGIERVKTTIIHMIIMQIRLVSK